MDDKKFKAILLVEIFLFLVALFWFVAKYGESTLPRRTFSVTGEGKEIAIPNIAEIRIGLISEGENLPKVQRENSEKFNSVIKFLKSVGIEEKDIKTEHYSVTPKYRYDKVSEIVGYSISQEILVKIKDLNKISEILENVVKFGANTIYGPNFKIDDEKVYLEKAREKAINDAKEKAKKIAEIAGFKLGNIVSLTESKFFPPAPYPYFAREGGGEEEIAPEIEAGSHEIKVSVTITYEIK